MNPEALNAITLKTLKGTEVVVNKDGKIINYVASRFDKYFGVIGYSCEVAVFSKTVNINVWEKGNISSRRTIKIQKHHAHSIGSVLFGVYSSLDVIIAPTEHLVIGEVEVIND